MLQKLKIGKELDYISKESIDNNFKQQVNLLVSAIPKLKVMTYGQIAAICGSPRSARVVGGLAHFGDINLPWHRVVNSTGGLANGYPGGKNGHKQVMEAEGYIVSNYKVDLEKYLWNPKTNPLIVIVGPTASGKTTLAIEIAKKFNGEIICADSRTIYKGMDIGTAKPTSKEQQQIKHYILDVVYPDEKFTVADFKYMTEEAIEEIVSKEKIPIIVGGSGLYIDSLIYDYKFRPINNEVRENFSNLSVKELQNELIRRGIPLPQNKLNHRYLLRSLEAGEDTIRQTKIRDNTLLIGLNIERDVLKQRIEDRVEESIKNGLLKEIKKLNRKYDWDLNSMQAPAYKAFRPYFEDEASLEECMKRNTELDNQLAKKQRTWFKRNKSIRWVDDPSNAIDIVDSFLNKTT